MDNLYPPGFARFYDTIYHQMRDDVDSGYFLNEIRSARGKVLEIGAGTGRLFTCALEQGADIYGLDISESMLDILRGKLGSDQQHRISRQNIIDFSLDHRFDLIIAPFRVLMHLLEKADQVKAINNVYDHLNPGGRFIFDLFIPDLRQLINGLQNHTDFDGEYEPGRRLKRTVTTHPDLNTQTIMISFRLEWEESDGLKQETWDLPLRFFFRFELEHLIERTKFESYTIDGDYSGSKLTSQSKDYVIRCLKGHEKL